MKLKRKTVKQNTNANKKAVLISGWYGFGNLGDESILFAMAKNILKEIPEIQVYCFSMNPAYTKSFQHLDAIPFLPTGLLSWLKGLASGKVFKTLYQFLSCDVLVLGGGGFLSDWQPEAPWVWLRQALLARLLGRKVMLYGIGAGPFTRPFGKWITRTIINSCIQAVTVRDEKSREWLLAAGVKNELIEVTADPAVRYPVQALDKSTETPRTVGICAAPIFHRERYWPGKQEKYLRYANALAYVIKRLIEAGFKVLFIPMQENTDRTFADDVLKNVPYEVRVLTVPAEINKAVVQLTQADILVTMRFHAAVLGALQGIPVAGIIYHHKIAEFIDFIGMREFAVELGDGSNWTEADIDQEQLVKNICKIAANYAFLRDEMMKKVRILQMREKRNAVILRRLMEPGK